jgi:Otopetrin
MFQVVFQLLFIADVSRRRVHLPEHERTKPGRQVVTFLLICNITMWVIYTFEVQKVSANPVQVRRFSDYAVPPNAGVRPVAYLLTQFLLLAGFLRIPRLGDRATRHAAALHLPPLPLGGRFRRDLEDELQAAVRVR